MAAAVFKRKKIRGHTTDYIYVDETKDVGPKELRNAELDSAIRLFLLKLEAQLLKEREGKR